MQNQNQNQKEKNEGHHFTNERRPFTEKLFANNRVIMVLAVVISIGLWIGLVSNGEPSEETYSINDVPVETTLTEGAQTELGLEIITGGGQTITVNVKCTPLTYSSIQKSDIVVTAQTSKLTEPGSYTVGITARKANNSLDFEIASIEPNFIYLKIDRIREQEFKIENAIKFKVLKGAYFASEVIFAPDKITISGPEAELFKISRVEAVAWEEGELSETKTITASIVLYDQLSNEIDYASSTSNLQLPFLQVSAQIPIFYEMSLPVTVSYINKPFDTSGLNLKISPSIMKVGAPKSAFDEYKEVFVGEIDFSTVKPGENTSFTRTVTLPAEFKNRDNVEEVTVTMNLDNYETKVFNVSEFSLTGKVPDAEYTLKTKSIPVTIVGPAEVLSTLTETDIFGIIDVSSKAGFTGQTEVSVKFTIKGGDKCWVYGAYPATVQIS